MRKKIVGMLIGLAMTIGLSAGMAVSGQAETTTIIYSGIEGGQTELIIDNALYPGESTRTWYCNGAVFTPDGLFIKDTSSKPDAKLHFYSLSVSNHMETYRVIDNPANPEAGDKAAKIYVISKINFNAGTLTTKLQKVQIGEELFAKNITLYVNNTPFPNFYSLEFLGENGSLNKSITVAEGTNEYTLVESTTGKTVNVTVEGTDETVPPVIESLKVKDNLGDKFAQSKVIECKASDDYGLAKEAYYWESNEEIASKVKEMILAGERSRDISGISWEKSNEYKVTANGKYCVFVRDIAGNISYRDIIITKISNTIPSIESVTVGVEDGVPYVDVSGKDKDLQPLMYKINKGAWQAEPRIKDNIKDGENTIYLKNESGSSVYTTKVIYKDALLDKIEELTEEKLSNYIKVTPSSWTNQAVTVSLELPESVIKKLTIQGPYSINGSSFTTGRNITVTQNGQSIKFSVKDMYDHVHSTKSYTVNHIDREEPYCEITNTGANIKIKAGDNLSGVQRIEVNSTSAKNFVIWSTGNAGEKSKEVTYTAPVNGSFQFTVYDFAGNSTRSSVSITSYPKTNDTIKSTNTSIKANTKVPATTVKKDTTKTSKKDTEKLRSGSTTGGESGSSTLGTKESKQAALEEAKATYGTLSSTSTKISNAGHTQTPYFNIEEKKIEILKENAAGSGYIEMMPEKEFSTKEQDMLKTLIFIVPVIVLAAVAVVIIVNTKRKGKRK